MKKKKNLRDAWAEANYHHFTVPFTKYPFIWVTQEGEELFLEEMLTPHLFYSVRMLFNHTVPAGYQIPGCKVYDLSRFPIEKRAVSVRSLLTELAGRSDLSHKHKEQLVYMVAVAARMIQPALPNGPIRISI